MGTIKTDDFSAVLRRKAINLARKKILLAHLKGSDQESDITEGANCNGYGRIRHFRRATSPGWPANPLPIDPACHRLGLPSVDVLRAQVFQNSACNWRCWYCFVPFPLLLPNSSNAAMMSAAEMIDLHLKEGDPAKVIDLSGGQPDLTPEWIPWMMAELKKRGLDQEFYLWSDDNLSNDYLFRFLGADEIELIKSYRNYGKVCCFKGFDAESFAFNTDASPQLFDRQFELFGRYLELGIDLYAYATFTSPSPDRIGEKMAKFLDRLQAVHPNLPLRLIPLEISSKFVPVQKRVKPIHESAILIQQEAIKHWNQEIEKRFAKQQRQQSICENSFSLQ